jgi:hypothetical protein
MEIKLQGEMATVISSPNFPFCFSARQSGLVRDLVLR